MWTGWGAGLFSYCDMNHSPRPPGDTSPCVPCPKDLITCRVRKHCGSERKVSCQSGAQEYQVNLGAYRPPLKVSSRGGVPQRSCHSSALPWRRVYIHHCAGPPECDSSALCWGLPPGSVTVALCSALHRSALVKAVTTVLCSSENVTSRCTTNLPQPGGWLPWVGNSSS